MTTYTATMTKIKDAETLGEYKPTSIDERKANADARIVYVDDGKFTLRTDTLTDLKGRGIKKVNGGYEVTRNALAKLEKLYEIVTDF